MTGAARDVSCRADRVYRFSPGTTALLVIDMQKDFFAEDTECRAEMDAIVPRVGRLIDAARRSGTHVVFTRESYRPDLSDVSGYRASLGYVGRPGPVGRMCIRGEDGQAFVGGLEPRPGESVFDKAAFGAFHGTALDVHLAGRGIDHLILCGVTTQCCVHSTLREAVDRGYWCLTVADCCAAQEPGLHDAALAIIQGEGHLFGWICDVADVEAAVGA